MSHVQGGTDLERKNQYWIDLGTNRERERIIKLLEADMEHAFGDDGKCIYQNHHREVCNCDIIALIKGKNTSKVSSADTFEVEMPPKYWGCETCGQEYPEDANWCARCQTYKNFGWIGED